MKKLEITGLPSMFAPHIQSADHVKAGKPTPDLFLHSAAQLDARSRKQHGGFGWNQTLDLTITNDRFSVARCLQQANRYHGHKPLHVGA